MGRGCRMVVCLILLAAVILYALTRVIDNYYNK